MKEINASADPSLLLAACIPAHAKSFGEWRTQPYDQFCLVTDGDVALEIGSRKFEIGAPALVLIHRGERHGYWKLTGQTPLFWVLFFRSVRSVYEQLPDLGQADPSKRVWRLSTNQVSAFKGMFVRIIAERALHPDSPSSAESAWLRLLMVTVQRWVEPLAPVQETESISLKPKINGHAAKLDPLDAELPTYEALRLLFGKTFRTTPNKL